MTPDSTSEGNRFAQHSFASEILSRNHNERPATIIELLKGSLEAVPVDPIPTEITISNIVISRDSQGGLTITCNVTYVVEVLENI